MVAAPTSVEIFCSYAHEDEAWRQKLETHLSVLKRQGSISLWHDRLIAPGTDWAKTIDTHLETASVIVLLVSADFFASDYCYGIEMKRALERQGAGEARVIPILVRPTDWQGALFAHLQVLPTDAKPIASWRNKDTALADVAAGIRRAIDDLPLLAASAPRAALPAIWNIPYPRNPFFLGRETDLALVRHQLHTGHATALSQPQAISGLGGIGKTQLALEYAYRYHQGYQAVLWAHAESTETLISSYIALATLLRLPECKARKQDSIVQAIKTWLQTHRDWLLILDNADELTLLPDFLPPSPGGHVLLTTRAAATGRLAHRLEIETLLPEHGALFLLRRAVILASDATLKQASPHERELAMQISEELGGLPLALDQAGAYLEETGMDLVSYWQIYQQHRVDLLQLRGELLVADHPAPVATTWSLSFQRVEAKNPAAADLLRLCAYLAPDTIAEEILTVGAPFLGPILQPVAADVFLLSQAIEVLRAYSLVQRDPQRKTLSIHRLVQAVLQDELAEAEQRCWAERMVLAVNAVFPANERGTWPQCELLLPHALLAAQLSETYQLSQADVRRLLNETASYLQHRARYHEAESLYQRSLRIRKQALGSAHPEVAHALNNLAELYREQGKYEQAESLYQDSLRIRKQALGSTHPEVAHALNNLANLYRKQGKHKQAESLYQRSLRIRKQALGPTHPEVAHALNNLADLYREQGKYEQAEPLYQHSLRIREQALGPAHPEVAHALNNLADLYREQGKYEQAEPLYQHSLRIREEALGPAHPEVAHALNNLAELYYKQGKYEQAEPLYQHSLRIREEVLGPAHPEVAHALNNLADLYREQGKYEQAEPLYQHSLRIREQVLGSAHPEVAIALNGLAIFYKKQGKYVEAEPLYQHALHIREQRLGPEHPETAEIIHNLARFWEAQDNGEEASVWYARALAVREQTLGTQHPKTRETRTRFIALLHALGQHEKAAQLEATQSGP